MVYFTDEFILFKVLAKGWRIVPSNVNRFLDIVNKKLEEFIESVSQVTVKANEQIEKAKVCMFFIFS